MADDGDAIGMGAITADLGANLVSVLVILLAAAAATHGLRATTAPEAPRMAEALGAAPLSGRAQSDLLYLRLHPDPDTLVIELTAEGAFTPVGGALRKLEDLPAPWPPRGVAFVFSPRHYDPLVRQTDRRGLRLAEITVPEALRRTDARAGQSGFSQAFLSLPTTADPASIRPGLLRLLTKGPAGSGLAEGGGASGSVLHWLGRVVKTGLNLALFLAALGLLRRLRARSQVQALPPAP